MNKKMCERLKICITQPIFSKWPMCDVTKSCASKRSKVQNKSMDFNVSEY